MTTGEYLVAHSTLPSGTALAHLLNLQIGGGVGETVFASRFVVATAQQDSNVFSTDRKLSVFSLENEPSEQGDEFDVHVLTRQLTLTIRDKPGALVVTTKNRTTAVLETTLNL